MQQRKGLDFTSISPAWLSRQRWDSLGVVLSRLDPKGTRAREYEMAGILSAESWCWGLRLRKFGVTCLWLGEVGDAFVYLSGSMGF